MTKSVNTIDTITLTDAVDYGSTDTFVYSQPTYTINAIGGASGTAIIGAGGSGTSNLNWSNIAVDSNGIFSRHTISNTIQINGEDADIKVNGRSLMGAIQALEERLNILVPNPELEADWDELRELGERYRALERKCKEKGEMWKKLKQMPPPELD